MLYTHTKSAIRGEGKGLRLGRKKKKVGKTSCSRPTFIFAQTKFNFILCTAVREPVDLLGIFHFNSGFFIGHFKFMDLN